MEGSPAADTTVLLWTAARNLLEVTEVGVEALVRVSRRLGPAVEDAMKTGADVLREEGREQGREQGRAEGEARGRAETLLRQLRLKFGALPDDVATRVRSADLASPDRWIEAVLFASTLDETLS